MPRSKIPVAPTNDGSTVVAHGYDAETKTLVMQFSTAQGLKEVEYSGMGPEQYAELQQAQNANSWWFRNKGNFPVFKQMNPDD